MGKKRECKLPSPGLCNKGRQHNQKLEYGRIPKTLFKRDKKAIRSAEYALSENCMVRKIPRDHKGLYLSDPFTHGRQSKISGEDAHKKVGWDTTPKPCVKC
jgi:hypothetical protein